MRSSQEMDSIFEEICHACQEPRVNKMKEALILSRKVPALEANFLMYLSCFTHYEEARSYFQEFGLKVKYKTPCVYDELGNTSHLKILINDLSHEVENLSLDYLSQKYSIKKFTNNVFMRKANGEFVENYMNEVRGFDLRARQQYMAQLNPGLFEELISLSIEEGPARVVYHISCVPARNIVINMTRLFTNTGAVLMVNHWDQMFNLSIAKLEQKKEIYYLYKAAKWYFVDIDLPHEFIEFLRQIGAHIKILQNQGEEADYITQVITEMNHELKSNDT